eukprot:2542961-Rhodomonas_salina.1
MCTRVQLYPRELKQTGSTSSTRVPGGRISIQFPRCVKIFTRGETNFLEIQSWLRLWKFSDGTGYPGTPGTR